MLPRPVLFPVLCAAGLALAVSPARAVEIYPDGHDKLEKAYKETHGRINNLINGTTEATKDDQDAIDTLAKWYAYRLTWTDYENKPGLLNSVMQELDSELLRATRTRPATEAFLKMFTTQLIAHTKEVLQNHEMDPIAKVNEARILDRVAQVGNQDVVDVLVDIVKDPQQNDGTRYWAFKGLQDIFAPPHGPQTLEPQHWVPPIMLKDQERQKRCIEVLNQYILKPMPVTEQTPPEQVEGMQVLRREAIRALGLTSYPAVADPQTKKLQSETALTLARVVVGDRLLPLPRWDEQLEAAIGLGWMQVKLYPEYQPDYAAWFVGRSVSVLAALYAEAGSTPHTNRGWRWYAERLGESLEAMQRDTGKNVKDKAVAGYVKDVYKQSMEQIKLITSGGQANPANLNDWLQNNAPKSTTIYQGVPDAKVRFGGGGTGGATEKEK